MLLLLPMNYQLTAELKTVGVVGIDVVSKNTGTHSVDLMRSCVCMCTLGSLSFHRPFEGVFLPS